MPRLAVLSDVHGNARALEAVREAILEAAPDVVAVAGDHVLNGPDPVASVDLVRELEAGGALVRDRGQVVELDRGRLEEFARITKY